MILRTLCNTCLQPFELVMHPSEVEMVKSVTDDESLATCPRLCGGKIAMFGNKVVEQMSMDPRLKDPMRITGKELYQAINGLGLPDEMTRDPSAVDALLRANAVRRTVFSESNGKLYLHELELTNGVTIHLTAGPRGAEVLKVTKRRGDGVPTRS